ncbi:MAG TPA: lytic transglycosylase domain-containing protein [Bacillales bacterium]
MDIRMYQTFLELRALQQFRPSGNPVSVRSFPQMNFATILENQLQQLVSSASNFETEAEAKFKAVSARPQTLGLQSTKVSESHGQFNALIQQAADKYGVDSALIRSVIHHESGFNPLSRSSAGALGLMQLMPATARGLGVENPFDPKQNIEGGTKYLKQMLERYNGNKALALAAYNAGPGNVDEYGGIPPFEETRNYVRRVLNTYTSI